MLNGFDPDWILAAECIGGPLLGVIIWLVRLEGKVKSLYDKTKGLDKSVEKSDLVFEKVFDKLSKIEVTLAKVEGKLSNEPKVT